MQNSILGLIPITDKEFFLISGLVYDKFGINLTEQKKPLIVGRLNKILRKSGFETFQEYFKYVSNDTTGRALSDLIDRISTNHSYFFREKDHFEFIRNTILPELIAGKKLAGNKTLRIWSAGCAAGEEVYSLSILLHDYFGNSINAWDIGILATDISLNVLTQAREGKYPIEKISEVPPLLFNKFFTAEGRDTYLIKQCIKDMVMFKRLNLMNNDFPFNGKFDIIFCRNVMIYFDTQTRNRLVERFHRYLQDGGYLLIGHSESLGRENGSFKYIKPATYRKLR
jgi:chemotaxis protein methyltransferase CheR